jgi:hypothetical protein
MADVAHQADWKSDSMTMEQRWEKYIDLLLYKSKVHLPLLNAGLADLNSMIFSKEV